MTLTIPETPNRHFILAAIKTRYGTLARLADRCGVDKRHLTVALRRPYLKAEKAIAKALDVPPSALWPDRYEANGQRKRGKKAAPLSKSQFKNSTKQTRGL